MLTNKLNKLSSLGALCLAIALGAPAARAVCPPGANTTGVGFTLTFRHQNGVPIGPEGAAPCESIQVVANVSYPNAAAGDIVEMFSGGNITLQKVLPLPVGVTTDITPGGGIPLIGPPGLCATNAATVLVVQSAVFNYAITPADSAAGSVRFQANYNNGITTTGTPVGAFTQQDTFVAPILTVTVPPPPAVCVNAPITLTATVTGGTSGAALTYVWTNLATALQVGTASTFVPSTATPGTVGYQVTVRDGFGCAGSTSVGVTVLASPTCTVQNVSTCAGSQSSLTVTFPSNPNGGAQVVSWTRNGVTFDGGSNPLPVTAPGSGIVDTYVASIRDATGCTSTCTATVTGLPAPTCSITSVSACAGSQANLTLTIVTNPNGGAQVVSWTRNGSAFGTGGPNPLSVTVPAAGSVDTYVATVRDNSGCTSTCSTTVTGLAAPTCTVANVSTCAGSQSSLTVSFPNNPNGGAAVTSWTRNGATFDGGSNPLPVTVPAAGIVDTYVASIRDASGCTSTCTATVTGLPAPTCSITSVSACAGSQANLTLTIVTNPNGGAQVVSWTRNGSAFGTGGPNPLSVTVPAAGSVDTYVATVRDNSGCTSTCSTTVTGLAAPTCTIANVSTCAGSQSSLTVSFPSNPNGGAVVTSWTRNGVTFDGGSNPLSVTAPGAGTVDTYVASIRDASGCTSTCTATVTGLNAPACSIPNVATCAGTQVSLTLTITSNPNGGAQVISWTRNGTAFGTGGPNPLTGLVVPAAGSVDTYVATVRDNSGCTSTCSATVTGLAAPTCTIQNVSTCAGNQASLAVSFPTNPNGGASVTSWTRNGVTFDGGSNPLPVTAPAAGVTDTYVASVRDASGCTSTCSATVSGLASPTCTINAVRACAQNPASLTVTITSNPNGGAQVVSWTKNGTTLGSSANPLSVTVPAAGTTETYVATVLDSKGCSSTCTTTVSGLASPTCSIQGISLCENSQGSLNVTFATNPNGGARVLSWTKNGATFDGGSNPLTVSAPGAGLVDTYVATITDASGCSSTCSATVSQYPRPFVSLQPITLCTGSTASLRATVDACAPTTFAWTGPNGFTATGNPINVTVRGTYTVTVTDCHNCTSSATTTVSIDTLVCAVSPAFCILCNGDTQTLTASPVGGKGPFTYRWSDNSTSSTLTTNKAGIYTVTITDSLGCSSTCSAQVTVDIIACLITPSCVSCSVCNGSSVTLDGSHIGGLAPFQYVWSTGEISQSIVVTQAGSYTLQVSDGNGCVASQTVNVGGCTQCVTRDSTYWFTHVVSPPGIVLPSGTSCATLQAVFARQTSGLMNLGFLNVNLDQALGLFWGSQSSTGDGLVRGDPICIARKQLSIELITAIANTTLLNADSTGCGIRDPNTGSFIPIAALIQEAQAATVADAGTMDCNHQTAWLNEMNGLTPLLHSFNAAGTGGAIPSNLVACGVGFANASYVSTHQPDPTTAANCACAAP